MLHVLGCKDFVLPFHHYHVHFFACNSRVLSKLFGCALFLLLVLSQFNLLQQALRTRILLLCTYLFGGLLFMLFCLYVTIVVGVDFSYNVDLLNCFSITSFFRCIFLPVWVPYLSWVLFQCLLEGQNMTGQLSLCRLLHQAILLCLFILYVVVLDEVVMVIIGIMCALVY